MCLCAFAPFRSVSKKSMKVKILLKLILVVLSLFIATSCDKDNENTNIDVDHEILKEMKSEGIPSVVACIVKDGEIVWQGTYGYANVYWEKPATNQTIYTLMSISKLFISTVVMQLWEQGKIDLDADINQYLPYSVRNPYYPDNKITSRHIMTHTSGLAWPKTSDYIPDFYQFFPYDEMPLISEWLPEYILPQGEQYRNNVWKEFRPGEMELYSNIGTSLLAYIVEQISGIDYMDWCQEYIFDPLEMSNTAFRHSHLNEELLATPYLTPSKSMEPYNYRAYPVGNVKSNIIDFSHFLIAMLNWGEYNGNRILKKTSVEKMFEIHNPASGTSLLWEHCPGDCIGHSGGGTGFSTRAEWYFDHNMGMVILSNLVNNSVYPKGRIYELVRHEAIKYQ